MLLELEAVSKIYGISCGECRALTGEPGAICPNCGSVVAVNEVNLQVAEGEVLRLMQKIVREQDQTLVMVTHDNNLASYADRRIRIMDGRIVGIETGGREALYEGNAEEKECNENESK